MKDCFEYGAPETLPFLIAHAFITVVSNVSMCPGFSHLFNMDAVNVACKVLLKARGFLW